jgi:hypothetical protein
MKDRHFSRVALVVFQGTEAVPDTRGVEPVAIHSILAVCIEYALLAEPECNIPVVLGSTRNRVAAGTGSFELAARKRILPVEVDNSTFPPAVGIRMFVAVDSMRLFDPDSSVGDSTLTSLSPKSTWSDC